MKKDKIIQIIFLNSKSLIALSENGNIYVHFLKKGWVYVGGSPVVKIVDGKLEVVNNKK